MGTNQTPKRRMVGVRGLPAHICLAYLLVCTLLFTGVSFSRFASTRASSDTARVAAGVIATQGGTWDTITKTYTFTVFNTENGKTSEVAIAYDVVVKLNKALPDGVTISLDGTRNPPEGTTYTFHNAGVLVARTSSSNTHTLTFTGTDEITNTTEIQVDISIRAQQIN